MALPKNRSTGNLFAINRQSLDKIPIGSSADTGNVMDFDRAVLSPILSEHEHGLGVTGLRRIRQPHSRAPSSQPPSPNSSFALPPRSASMTLGGTTGRTFTSAGPSSPTLNLGEDLSRFPSESLHSFSFNHQSEDILHNRQNLLNKSMEFLNEKLDWASNNPGLVAAQARVSGDVEVQNMIELLAKANMLGEDEKFQAGKGALTGPPDMQGSNIFDKLFMHHTGPLDGTLPAQSDTEPNDDSGLSSPRSSQAEPSLNSSLSAVDLREPLSPPSVPVRAELKRTNTDVSLLTLQTKLVDVLARPFIIKGSNENPLLSPPPVSIFTKPANSGANIHSSVHGHANRWVPAAQAIFTTEAQAPWTILAANDLACLVFGVTKAEVKSLGILEVVKEERRSWLEERLRSPGVGETVKSRRATSKSIRITSSSSNTLAMRGGVTAHLLSKPSSRQIASQRSQTVGIANPSYKKKSTKGGPNHSANKSRGVLLCGDVVPIVKRNGNTGSASSWVKEKRGGLIWVLEEITEDSVSLGLDENGYIVTASGAKEIFCVENPIASHTHIKNLIPKLPSSPSSSEGSLNYELIDEVHYYAAQNCDGVCVPTSVTTDAYSRSIFVSSFPHIAGIVVLSAQTLEITSSNSVFSAALFGRADPDGLNITQLIPQFDKMLELLMVEEEAVLTDGVVIPEHSFRRARAVLALRESSADAAKIFSRPAGLVARHRDGSDINVDIQMRVVRSDTRKPDDSVIDEKNEDMSESANDPRQITNQSELVLALWITYSRQLHSAIHARDSSISAEAQTVTPRQPSPGQKKRTASFQMEVDDSPKKAGSHVTSLSQQIREAASQPISDVSPQPSEAESLPALTKVKPRELPKKKKITDFVVLEEMGQGAYGQVKLAKYSSSSKKVVLKYVTKRRILVDTWTRDRRLGTVPLEIHVLDYLRKDGLRHPNIVEMTDFFEDDVNYYIEMVPHGLPGMDLFDYIEMRSTMDEAECRNIFLQVVNALHHLHTKALVVHRDIKDENIILDGDNRVKLIDFGSAAYIKNGPFDVFVGTFGKPAPFLYCENSLQQANCFVLLRLQTMPPLKFCKGSHIVAKNKTCGLLASSFTLSYIRKILFTALTRSWTASFGSHGS